MTALTAAESPVWTGWVALELLPRRVPGSVGERRLLSGADTFLTLDVSLRLDVVTFWVGSRTLAVADRDELRAWTRHPVPPFAVDDLRVAVADERLDIWIDGTGPYPVAVTTSADLIGRL